MGKSKRPAELAGPDRLAMPEPAVRERLQERLQLGRALAPGQMATGPNPETLIAALVRWSSTTETAVDNLFVGGKTLHSYHLAGRMGIGLMYDTIQQRVDDAVERHRRRLEKLESIIDGLPYMREEAHISQPPRESPASWADRQVTINLQSGNVNLGTILGDVTSNVSGLTGADAESIKELMRRLATVVVDAALPDEAKAEAAEAVEVVSEGLKAGPQHRPSAMVANGCPAHPSAVADRRRGPQGLG